MDLKARFLQLWERVRAEGDALLVWEKIENCYTSPSRFYHNLDHLEDLLLKLDEFFKAAPEKEYLRNYLEWAIFFHDLIYEIRGRDNEEKSAEEAKTIALNAGLGVKFADAVSGLILATKHQTNDALNYAQLLMIELDLSILGAEPDVFDRYEKSVYQEYVGEGKIERETFRKGRSLLLEGFVKRKPIFCLVFFHHRYETQARENIARSITALS